MPHVRRKHQAHVLGEPQFQVRRCPPRQELAAFELAVINDKLLIACKSELVATFCVPFNKQVQVISVAFDALFCQTVVMRVGVGVRCVAGLRTEFARPRTFDDISVAHLR